MENEAAEARSKAKSLTDRLFRLGSCEWEQADVQHVEAKPLIYGTYISLMHDTEIPDETLSEIKKRLTEQLVRGLLDANMVQFIIHESDMPFEPQTVGAKLFVVPWENTVIKRKDDVFKRVNRVFDPLDQKTEGEG